MPRGVAGKQGVLYQVIRTQYSVLVVVGPPTRTNVT